MSLKKNVLFYLGRRSTEKGYFIEDLSNIEIINYEGNSIFNIQGKKKYYIDDEEKFRFIISPQEFYQQNKKVKQIIWLYNYKNGNNEFYQMLNIYFHSLASYKKFEKENKEYFSVPNVGSKKNNFFKSHINIHITFLTDWIN
uniref:Uncharacterized protein n=1 Tax=viral metagenome TaxID=1070528 RepID=A0A6C0AEV5_9ZZZZ